MAWLTRRDGTVVIGSGPFVSSVEPPAGGVAFHLQDFAISDPLPWKIPSRVEHSDRAGLAAKFPGGGVWNCEWQALDAAPFSEVFQEIMAAIHGGIFEKTVPVVTECGVVHEAPGAAIVSAMVSQAAPLQSYGWSAGSRGFAGATPELLFSLHDGHFETMALAGTARSEDRDVFAVDEKEIREHEYVAQTLVSKLLDLGELRRLPREILDLGPIVHFLTPIDLVLDAPHSPAELLARLHPTPALGPLPRTRETLSKLIEWRRRLACPPEFGAPFGLWENGRFDAIVAIRGVWWDELRVRIPAGCGIIEASRLVNEWRELRLKREAVKRFFRQHG
jgi:menaquinone-specific isochorismate synthase